MDSDGLTVLLRAHIETLRVHPNLYKDPMGGLARMGITEGLRLARQAVLEKLAEYDEHEGEWK